MISFIDEINSFYRWMETHEMTPNAIALWMALMKISNDAGWKMTFNASNSMLMVKTGGLSIPAIHRARNLLQQQGRINFRARKGNLSSEYTIIPFAERKVKQTDQQMYQQSDQQTDSKPTSKCISTPTTYLEENKTRGDMGNNVRASISPVHDLDFGEVAQVWSDTIRPITPFQAEELHDLYKTYGKEQVIWAIQAIPEKQKRKIRSVRYIEAILESRDNGDYHSRQKQPQTAADVYEEMTRAIPQQEDDPEKIAAWMREEGVDLDAFTKSGGHGAD